MAAISYNGAGEVGHVFKKLNKESPPDQTLPFLGICPREMKTYTQHKTWTQMFTTAYSQKPNSGNNPYAHQLLNGETKCGPPTMATKRNEALTHATARMNPGNVML